MAIETFTATETFNVETCCKCGVRFGVPVSMQTRLRQDRTNFYCPNGHPQHYTGENNAELVARLREQIARERQRADQRQAELRDEAERERRRGAAARGQVTRVRNRVGRGVCPCCNRYFANLHRHMAGRHPEYTAPAADAVDSTTA